MSDVRNLRNKFHMNMHMDTHSSQVTFSHISGTFHVSLITLLFPCLFSTLLTRWIWVQVPMSGNDTPLDPRQAVRCVCPWSLGLWPWPCPAPADGTPRLCSLASFWDQSLRGPAGILERGLRQDSGGPLLSQMSLAASASGVSSGLEALLESGWPK